MFNEVAFGEGRNYNNVYFGPEERVLTGYL
ncbi:hypothetical protein ES705_15236 [subsurface metagenome]